MSGRTRVAGAAVLVLAGLTACTTGQLPGTATTSPPPPAPSVPQYPSVQPPAVQEYRVDSVYDGDTLRVFEPSGESVSVRVLGIDAPEMQAPRPPGDATRSDAPPPKPECGAVEARDAARAALLGHSVQLTEDLEQPGQDHYGRLLRYVYVDGSDLADILLNAGLVRVYEEYPVRHTPRYLEEQDRARASGAGSWAVCGWEN